MVIRHEEARGGFSPGVSGRRVVLQTLTLAQ